MLPKSKLAQYTGTSQHIDYEWNNGDWLWANVAIMTTFTHISQAANNMYMLSSTGTNGTTISTPYVAGLPTKQVAIVAMTCTSTSSAANFSQVAGDVFTSGTTHYEGGECTASVWWRVGASTGDINFESTFNSSVSHTLVQTTCVYGSTVGTNLAADVQDTTSTQICTPGMRCA